MKQLKSSTSVPFSTYGIYEPKPKKIPKDSLPLTNQIKEAKVFPKTARNMVFNQGVFFPRTLAPFIFSILFLHYQLRQRKWSCWLITKRQTFNENVFSFNQNFTEGCAASFGLHILKVDPWLQGYVAKYVI